MSDIYNETNLRKHNVSKEEIDQVMGSQSSVWLPLKASRRDNARTMVVGFTVTGRLLEIGIEIMPDTNETLLFFHFMDATKQYRKQFEELGK